MEERGGGVLLSIDEIHRGAVQDLRIIAQEIQHAIREDKAVAFVGAGLPEAVGDLLNDGVLTFLRRADRHDLGTVSDDDVAEALDVPLRDAGKRITQKALDLATAGTRGYPYLIQGVGHGIWRASAESDEVIGIPQAEEGVRAAIRRIGSLVHAASLTGLSDVDKSVLAAMAVDDGPSRMHDLQKRLGVDPQYTNTYKQRLLERGLIQQVSRGYIDFAIPCLRDYLREHVVTQHLQDDSRPCPPAE